jgi:hypothetical protein
MKKIKVKWNVDIDSGTETISFDELGCTEEEWKVLTEEEQMQMLQEFLDGLSLTCAIVENW